MKKKSKVMTRQNLFRSIFATIGVATIFFLCSLSLFNVTSAKEPVVALNSKANLVAELHRVYTDSIDMYSVMLDSIETQLIAEVDEYIHTVSKNSKMTGQNIVQKCIEYDYDISLLMAQAHQETHFAKYGGRNNVFGIVGKRYSHPDKAVEDYINLMQRRYIINRTPEQLIKSGFRLENSKGKYAEAPNYAVSINNLRNKIINNTEIHNLFLEYKHLVKMRDIIYAKLNSILNDTTLNSIS